MSKLNVGLFGFGVVGEGFYQLLSQSELNEKIHIKKIVIKDAEKARNAPKWLFSNKKASILDDPEIQVVVEAINDPEDALLIAKSTLKQGKVFISASKKVISENLPILVALAKENHTSLLYEAAVCGGIPVIKNIQQYLVLDKVREIEGILNGSSNYILSRLFSDRSSYDEALKKAQNLGFAEADPYLDVSGRDAAHKLSLLIANSFGKHVAPEAIPTFGIDSIGTEDVQFAKEQGWKIKLINRATIDTEGNLSYAVLPTFVDMHHPLYQVENENNAVKINAAFSGAHTWIGKGAGSFPTGLAVFNDVAQVLQSGGQLSLTPELSISNPLKAGEGTLRFYIRNTESLGEFWRKYQVAEQELLVSSGLLIDLIVEVRRTNNYLIHIPEGIIREQLHGKQALLEVGL